jgi:HPt (histidine-containing phosphotransfer) domain-containing protein
MPDETLDPAALAELLESVGNDRDFLVELVDTYLLDSPHLVAALRSGLASMDAASVRRAAHTLKSTSATFGAARLAALSREIEAAATGGDLSGLPPSIDAAAAEYEVVAEALRAAAAADRAGDVPA